MVVPVLEYTNRPSFAENHCSQGTGPILFLFAVDFAHDSFIVVWVALGLQELVAEFVVVFVFVVD